MKKPVLVVMAAGLGSRYGGLKQIDPVSKDGKIIMDYSIYDAKKAGFSEVIFIIKEELLDTFKETIGVRASKLIKVSYAFQALDKYTNGNIPEGREKPFGTGHAVLCAKDQIDGPFAVINADDFYGYEAFKLIYDFLESNQNAEKYSFTMVGYKVENTLTENGFVSRGVCKTDENSNLTEIVERTQIEFVNGKPAYTEDAGNTYTEIPESTPVSMNMLGFTKEFLNELESEFEKFMQNDLSKNLLKGEFYLPFVIDTLIKTNKADVKVLKTNDKWYGITYKDDKPVIEKAILEMTEKGLY